MIFSDGCKLFSRIEKYSRFIADYSRPCGPRVGYIGGVYGGRNLGDEALRIAATILFSDCTILEYPRKPEIAKLASRFLPVNNGLLAGGTLINQRILWLEVADIYVSKIPNFIVFGTGVGHPAFWDDRRKEWKEILKRCSFVGVRGPLSAQLLSDVHCCNIEIVGDPALVFALQDHEQSECYIQNMIGLNIGWDMAKQWGSGSQIISEMTKFVTLVREAKWRVRWFVICPSDIEITTRIAEASNTADNICYVYDNPLQYIDFVKHCSVFVGTRLHSVVLACCAYVPTVMLEYRPKCRDFMQSIEHEHNVIKTDELRGEQIWELVRHLNKFRNKYSYELFRKVYSLYVKQKTVAQKILQTMR